MNLWFELASTRDRAPECPNNSCLGTMVPGCEGAKILNFGGTKSRFCRKWDATAAPD
jgi:hypothetical protein